MNRFVRYTNGNYTVTIDTRTGTKIRENDFDFFRAEFPESMDIKICDKCDMGCPMCHENSTPDGKCGDILNAKFIETLHPYTELAIGGGNPLEHPDLEPFLVKCKLLNLIPSMTVNQTHFMKNRECLKRLCDAKLIYGLGISVNKVDNDFLEAVKDFPNAVLHVINGLITIHDLAMLAGKDLKILILGYKEFRRGKDLFKRDAFAIERRKKETREWLGRILDEHWFEVVSFDNLAVNQLEVRTLIGEETWNEFYMGDDGTATMYVDMVKGEYAKSSTSTERYPIEDNIIPMFEKIRTN